MSNWDDDDDAYCTSAGDFQDARRVCDALQHCPCTESVLRRSTASGSSRISCANMPRAARRIRTCCATAKSSSASVWTTCTVSAPRGSPPAITRRLRNMRPTGTRLLKAADTAKDQSYFLHGVAESALRKTLFPIGELHKPEVRRLAHAAGLPVYDKPDSTGICFIGERPFQEFLSRYLRTAPGPIENHAWSGHRRASRTCAVHPRPALGLGHRRPRRQRRRALVRRRQGHGAQCTHRRAGSRSSAAAVRRLRGGTAALAELRRARARQQAGSRMRGQDSLSAERSRLHGTSRASRAQRPLRPAHRRCRGSIWRINLGKPARAVTPGQYAVFYRDDHCLGGGVIARRFNSCAPYVGRGITYNSRLFSGGVMTDSFKARTTLNVGAHAVRDPESRVRSNRTMSSRLPFSLKILLENLLRFEDGVNVTKSDIEALLHMGLRRRSPATKSPSRRRA